VAGVDSFEVTADMPDRPNVIPVTVTITKMGTILAKEPPPGALTPGAKFLVDDGSCPAGQLDQVTGGNTAIGIARQHRCIPRPS
jgi:hypothetical protein